QATVFVRDAAVLAEVVGPRLGDVRFQESPLFLSVLKKSPADGAVAAAAAAPLVNQFVKPLAIGVADEILDLDQHRAVGIRLMGSQERFGPMARGEVVVVLAQV